MKKAVVITCSDTEYSGVSERVSCIRYATLNDYDVVKTFYFGESDSKSLDSVIDFCLHYLDPEDPNGHIQYILVNYEDGFVSEFLNNDFLNALEENQIYLKTV